MMFSVTMLLSAVLVLGGHVRDANTRAPLAGVTVQVVGTSLGTVTDSAGAFTLDAASGTRVRFSRIGYASYETTTRAEASLEILLIPSATSLERVTISAIRGAAGEVTAPIAQTAVLKEELERRYSGQEMPLLLTGTPSLTSFAESGAASNYTYMRLRGIDQTRINITLDGVPLNDAEDQGVFFSNFPDFGNSIQSVQIQRGVGTSSQGTAPYAGSINFESIALARAPRGGELQVSTGSFGTRRVSGEWQSGLLANRLAFYGRLSGQDTDGFRYHSGNRSSGGFVSGGYFGERFIAKVTALAGVSRNQSSYVASPEGEVEQDPRVNALTPEERDHFTTSMVSASITTIVGAASTFSATAYRVNAGGDYDVAIDPDLWNFNLNSRVDGAFASWNTTLGATTLNVGAHGSTYHRNHFVFVRPDFTQRSYLNTGEKDDASAFAKVSVAVGRASLFGDLQVRRVWFRYLPDDQAGISRRSIDWNFVNPKVGVTYTMSPSVSVYGSLGSSGREPTRNDMFAGFDNIDTSNVDFVGALSRVRPERVRDIEMGAAFRSTTLDASANLFLMDFRNEIAAIGALSYIGLPLRKNVRQSYRRGVELDATFRGVPRLFASSNVTLSRNRIAEYTDDASGETFRDVPPLLTPAVIANQSVEYRIVGPVSLLLDGRYQSRSYLANTGDARFELPASYVLDGGVTWRIGSHSLIAQVRNIGDATVFTSGYTDGSTSYYYPLAGRNVMITARVGF